MAEARLGAAAPPLPLVKPPCPARLCAVSPARRRSSSQLCGPSCRTCLPFLPFCPGASSSAGFAFASLLALGVSAGLSLFCFIFAAQESGAAGFSPLSSPFALGDAASLDKDACSCPPALVALIFPCATFVLSACPPALPKAPRPEDGGSKARPATAREPLCPSPFPFGSSGNGGGLLAFAAPAPVPVLVPVPVPVPVPLTIVPFGPEVELSSGPFFAASFPALTSDNLLFLSPFCF